MSFEKAKKLDIFSNAPPKDFGRKPLSNTDNNVLKICSLGIVVFTIFRSLTKSIADRDIFTYDKIIRI